MEEHRWANVEAARAAYLSDRTEIDAGPLEAFFEIAARCNLRCQMCAINYDSRYRAGNGRPPLFEPELFERLEPTFATLLRVSLFGLGEPLLNRHLTQYVRRLAAAGVEVSFTTNATLIDDEKAEELSRAGIDRVTVSIDGATPHVYEGIRVGARFEDVVRGIRALAGARRRFGRPSSLSLSFVAMASNFCDLPRLVDLCGELGADSVHVEPLYWQPQRELQEHYQRENLGRLEAGVVERLLDEAVGRAHHLGVGLGSRFFEARGEFDYTETAKDLRIDWKCSEPWSSIWVTTAGEVRTCCINERSFGNLFERSFREIWNGDEFVAFRKQHARREVAEGCATCYLNGRVRQSPFFAPTHPVTYRPLARTPSPGAQLIEIDSPDEGATVTDPIVITGRLLGPPGEEWELMLDETPIGPAARAWRSRPPGAFVLCGPIPFVTEGAHLLWAKRRGDREGEGAAWREVYVWRPEAAVGVMRATTTCAVLTPKRWPVAWLRPEVDGRTWPRARSLLLSPTTRLTLLDLNELVPGKHDVRLRVNGRLTPAIRVERLPRN